MTIILLTVIFTACGSNKDYDFSDYELSNALGMDESSINKAVIKFKKDDVNNGYTSEIVHDKGVENVNVGFNSKKAISLCIFSEGNF